MRQGNLDGWTTSGHSVPLRIRICVWLFSEAGNGKDTLDAHFGWIQLSWDKYLLNDGDIISPRDMFDAAIAYPVANTSFIIADTSHSGFATKFNAPTLSVRAVHEYAYNEDGNVELYHHSGLKKKGIYEKLWFTSPPPLPPHPSQEARAEYKRASLSHKKIEKWMEKNRPEFKHAVMVSG